MKINIKSELKKVITHAPVYSLGSILSQLVGFLMIPVYTRFLSPDDYGILQLVVLTADIIGIAAGLKVTDTMLRLYYESDDPKQRNTVISTGFIILSVMGLIFLIPLIASSNILAGLILKKPDLGYLFQMAFISMICNMLISIAYAYIQILEKSVLFVTLSLSRLFLALTLNIYFVVFLKIGVQGIVLSTFITSILYLVITTPILLKKVGFKFSWPWTKQILRFGLPYIPSTMANKAAHASDRYFIRFFLTLGDVGIYSLGYRIGAVIHNIFSVSIFRILNVRIFAIHKLENAPVIFAKMATYSTMFLVFFGLGLSIFAMDIIMIMTPEKFWGAGKIIPPIVLCYIIFASESFAVIPILISKKTERLSIVNISAGIICVSLNLFLIPRYGISGAILSTFISFVLKISGLYWIGRKLFKIPYEWKRLCLIFLCAILLFGISKLVYTHGFILRLSLNSLIWLSFVPALWFFGIVTKEEKIECIDIVQNKVVPLFK